MLRALESSYGDGRGDVRLGMVVAQGDVFGKEVANVLHGGIQFQRRQWARFSGQLPICLLAMVHIQMHVSKSEHQVARQQFAYLRRHRREQRVGSEVKRHAEKQVRATLIHLTAERPVLRPELKENVTRRQRHLL